MPLEQPSDGKELEFDFSLDDLETIKVIGKGSGGVVQLVRHKWVGRLFALKVVTDKCFQLLLIDRFASDSVKLFTLSVHEPFSLETKHTVLEIRF